MRVVVTGATSMIGTALIEECIRQNDEVLAIVRENTKRIDRLPASSLIQVEYADLDSLKNIRGDGKSYDIFYHFAWGHTEKEQRDVPILQEHNIRTTLDAVEMAYRLGCHKFIGAGSQAEYGYVDEQIDENTPCRPTTSYGIAKMASGMFARRMCEQKGMECIWGRIFSVYGIHDNSGTMIDYALGKFLNNEDAEFSIASNVWNYLYESDAGEMFYCLGKLDVDAGIYNVASQDSRPLREYIKEIVKITETKGKANFVVEQKTRLLNLDVNINKIVKATGFIPRVDFASGITKMYDRHIRYSENYRH